MWQLFKPLTERQHLEKELDNAHVMREQMMREQSKINRMIDANLMMIQHLETELENMK